MRMSILNLSKKWEVETNFGVGIAGTPALRISSCMDQPVR